MSFEAFDRANSNDCQLPLPTEWPQFGELIPGKIRMDLTHVQGQYELNSDKQLHGSVHIGHSHHDIQHGSEKYWHGHAHHSGQHESKKHSHHHKDHAHHSDRRASDKHLPGLSVADEAQYPDCRVDHNEPSEEQKVLDLVDNLWCNKFAGQTPLELDQSSGSVLPPHVAPPRTIIGKTPNSDSGGEVESQWRANDVPLLPSHASEKIAADPIGELPPISFEVPAARVLPAAQAIEARHPQVPAPTIERTSADEISSDETNPQRVPTTNEQVTAPVVPTRIKQTQADPPTAALNNTGHFSVSLIYDMEQIPMTGALPNDPQNTVYAAKNDTQSVQIAIQAPPESLTNVNVSASDLKSADGSTIAGGNIKLYREHYVQVTRSSNSAQKANPANPAGAPGWYADGLIPFIDPVTGQPGKNPQRDLEGNNFKVQGGQNQPIWADVQIPADAKPGTYSGVVTVRSDQGQIQVPLQVHVWNFEAPTKPYLTTAFGATGTNNDAVQQVLLDNKISPVAPDPAHMKRDLAKGLTASTVGFFSGASYDKPTMSSAPSVIAVEGRKAAIEQAAGAGNNLLVYDYSADEIGAHPQLYPQVQQWGANLHAAGVANLITMAPTAALLSDGTSSGKPAVDIFTMLPVQYDKTAPSLMHDFKSKGAQMWSYNTLVQDDYSPKWELDYSPLNERLQAGFISQSNDLTGLLGWSVSNWSSDPWRNPYNGFAEPGEGVFVLPGAQAGLQGDAATIRLKALRDGVGDYNYAQILKSLGKGQLADQVSRSLGASFSNWSHDPVAVEKAHELMGNEIEKLQQQGSHQQ